MGTIAQVSQAIQKTLQEAAQRLGKSTKFVKRKSKMGGVEFVQTLVYAALGHPTTSYTHLCQTAGMVGVQISAQGLEQRFTPEATKLMAGVLQEAVSQRVSGSPTRIALLQRFNGVYIRDSCCVSLPKELYKQWPGVGSQQGVSAGVKLHVGLNYSSGELQGPVITNARIHDRKSPFHEERVPAGALRMADLGFFDLDQFAQDEDQESYWLSRYKNATLVSDENGERMNLVKRLEGVNQLDIPILLGHQHIACRLLVQRVPQEVVDQRRKKLHEYAVRKQVPVSPETLALAQWTILITNAPVELMSVQDALVLYRARWQIELLFKLWKQHVKIDEWRSQNSDRILCELYAKLIAVLIMHWNFMVSFWSLPTRSLFKAANVLQSFAASLAVSRNNQTFLLQTLECIQRVLSSGCSVNSRHAKPNTYQRLLNPLA